MSFLDMRTIVFSNVVTNIVCMLVILLLWHQSRNRFAGTGFWVFDYAFQAAALFLIILRGSIPDWMSMVLANTLVIAGALLGYMGLGRFVGKKISQVHNYVLLAAFVCIHTYFTFVQPNLAARNLNVSVGLLIICFQCMWLLLPGVAPGMRRLTFGVGMVFGAYCLVSIARIVEFFIGTHLQTGYFQSSPFEPFVLVSYKMLFILLTFSLVLMFNRRLLVEQEKLIQELQDALAKVKLLSGMLPICSSCKKIRDDKGYWTQIEAYVRDHSEADFSHGICPECAGRLYPDLNPYDEGEHSEPRR